MRARHKKIIDDVAAELRLLYMQHGGLNPRTVVAWAAAHPDSALYSKFEWDDTKAAAEYRLWQARELIVDVKGAYADGKERQIYVSAIPDRGSTGYTMLVDILSNKKRRAQFLAQALAEYERVGEFYHDLEELASIRAVVEATRRKWRRSK